MELDVVVLDDRLHRWGFPHRGSADAAGIDLHACLVAPLTLAPGDPPALVPAGFAMRLADRGWCGLVAPRSGLGHRGLVLGNTIGVIDADYTGPVILSVWNRNPAGGETLVITPGDRIAQLLFVPIGHPTLRIVEAFGGGTERGAGGFGSSGVAVSGPVD